METYRPDVGTRIEDLDTPCLLIDMDALDNNYGAVARMYRDTEVKMRQHAKNIKSPYLALEQIRAGGTVGGVCTAKVSEAEVMVEGGINDILVTSELPTREKMARLCDLSKRADIKVVVDNTENLRDLSEIAAETSSTIGVLIEVDTSMSRAGIRRVEDGVEIAKLAVELPGVVFLGVMSHQTVNPPLDPTDRETRVIEGHRYIGMCLAAKDAIEATGIPVEVVSTGESWTYDIATEIPGVTEVEGGTYALMGNEYTYMEDFDIAVKTLGTVISTPRPGTAIGDIGVRAQAAPRGALPTVEGRPEVTVEELHDETCVLRSTGPMPLKVGDQFLLHAGQQDMLTNRWDQFIGVRNGVVEGVWPIPARGCHH